MVMHLGWWFVGKGNYVKLLDEDETLFSAIDDDKTWLSTLSRRASARDGIMKDHCIEALTAPILDEDMR